MGMRTQRSHRRTRRPSRRAELLVVVGSVVLGFGISAHAQQQSVATTVHNLSASGPGEVKSISEDEICKFCHIPHNAVVPTPLWGQELSRSTYKMPRVGGTSGLSRSAPQPDGSSKLCLSCHDGTVALGETTGGSRSASMSGGMRLGPGQRGYLGTDLSGSHPISMRVAEFTDTASPTTSDIGLRPMAVIEADLEVNLDPQGKMQCTTCHDPHSDQYYREGAVPRFWVKPSLEEVCIACHELR